MSFFLSGNFQKQRKVLMNRLSEKIHYMGLFFSYQTSLWINVTSEPPALFSFIICKEEISTQYKLHPVIFSVIV